MTTTDTPRTDACPRCNDINNECRCFRFELKDELRHERSARQKAEAEVERLKANLCIAVEIAELPYCRYLHNAATYHKLTEIKATLNPDKNQSGFRSKTSTLGLIRSFKLQER